MEPATNNKFRPTRLITLFVCCLLSGVCSAQILCQSGKGSFQEKLVTGMQVKVGSDKKEGFAVHACQAELTWGKEASEKLVVEDHASQIDLDMFEVDLTGEGPVAAFQVKKSDSECCMVYRIYSLEKHPRLLRTLNGGFFKAADTDLDGRVEIWATDAAAVNAVDGMMAAEMAFPPTYVLRFDHGRLLVVNSEFQADFDAAISRVRGKIDPALLREFKSSDGKLELRSPSEAQRVHDLRIVKSQVLQIVCAYLYTDRDKEAWENLAAMWPQGDVERIRSAIVEARAHGIITQVDGVASPLTPTAKKKHAMIFEPDHHTVMPAREILTWSLPPLLDPRRNNTEVQVDMVIDSAGKVRSVTPVGREKGGDQGMLFTAADWKFIPALRNGHSVASRLHWTLGLKR